MNFKIKYIFIILISLFATYSYANNENKILFLIDDKAFTSIDLSNRLNYINVKENRIIEYNDGILEDYISVLLFSKYFDEIDLKNDINKLNSIQLNEIKERLEVKKNQEVIEILNTINKKDLIKNINFDIKRKIIIENELLKKKDILLSDNINEINNIYEIDIKLISINNDKKYDIDIKKNLDQVIEDLKKKQIKYLYKEKKLNFTEKIKYSLKTSIINNQNLFYIKNSTNTIYGKIIRKIKNPESIKFKLIQIKTNIDLLDDQLKCENIKNLNDKEYSILDNQNIDYLSLNQLIKENLIKINDYINIKDMDDNNYILLCNILYEDKVFENINTNNKINYFAKKIEKEILEKLKDKYKFNYQ